MSGFYYAFDPKAAVGSRLLQLGIRASDTATCVTPIQDNTLYYVVSNDFTINGGDGYTSFTSYPSVLLGEPAADAMANYITKNSPVNPSVVGRIVIATAATYNPLPNC